MDPEATLEEMRTYLRMEDHEAAAQCAQELLEWLAKGGFSPVPYSRETFILYLRTVIRRHERLKK